MPNTLLVGAIGGPNFGDEAILRAWIDLIRQRSPTAKIYCDGYNLQTLPAILGGAASPVAPEQSLWRQSSKLDVTPENASWQRIARDYFSLPMLRESTASLAELAKLELDHIQLIGGGYVNHVWPRNYALLRLILKARRYLGVTAVMTGQGLTPTAKGFRRGIGDVFLDFDHVDVRDRQSRRLFGTQPIPNLSFSGDDALLYFSSALKPPIRWLNEKALVLCLQTDLFPGTKTATRILTPELLRRCRALGINKVVFAAAMKDDVTCPGAKCARRLGEADIAIEIATPTDLLRDGFPLSREGLLITSRYHPHFFAALSGVCGVALCVNDY